MILDRILFKVNYDIFVNCIYVFFMFRENVLLVKIDIVIKFNLSI